MAQRWAIGKRRLGDSYNRVENKKLGVYIG
jgi:hypothetical protein